MKIDFTYHGGRTVQMKVRHASILQRLKRGVIVTRQASSPDLFDTGSAGLTNTLISDAVAKFAFESGIDIQAITGTGKDGRILKSDIEAAISARANHQV